MALEKLLSFSERQRLEEAGAGPLLWDEEEEEEGTRGGEKEDRRRRDGGDADGPLIETKAGGGGGGRRGAQLHSLPSAPTSAPPTVTLPLACSHAPPR